MADSKRQLILDLLARDKTKQATDSAAKNLDDVAKSAEVAAKGSEKLGKESDKAEDQVQRFGKSSRTAAEHVERLDREIESVERELKQLAVSFAEADAAAERLDLSKAIRRTQADLRKLNQSKGLIKDLLPDEKETDDAGKSFAARLASSIGEGLTGISTKLGSSVGPTIGGAIAIAAAPELTAALGSALSAGAGLGALGVGIMAAVKGDREIQDAGKAAGKQFMQGLQDEAKVLKPAVLDSLNVLSGAGDQLNKDLGRTFDALSGKLVPFTRKVTDAGGAVTGSLLKAARESGPAIDGLGDSIVLLGQGVGKFIDEVADGGPQAADNLRTIAGAIGDMVGWTGEVIHLVNELGKIPGLTGITPMVNDFYRWKAVATTAVGPAADGLKEKLKNLDGATLSAGEAAGKAGLQMQTFGDRMADAATKGQGLYSSQTAVAQALADTAEAAKKNGHTLDLNTQKGRDNRTALDHLAAALTANYAAYVKVNGEGRAAQGVAQRNRDAFIGLAVKMGLARDKAAALASELGLIPAKKTTNFYANTHDAAGRIAALNRSANNAARSRTLSFNISVTGAERLDNLGHRIGGYRAAGGPVMAGRAYIVGEKRPEVFVPDSNGRIIPSVSRAAGGGAAMGGGIDGGWVAIRGDALMNTFVQAIATHVSAKGGRAAQLGIRFT